MASASQNLVPVTLKLGGKSPAVVHPTIHQKSPHKDPEWQMMNGGQSCFAPDYLLCSKV